MLTRDDAIRWHVVAFNSERWKDCGRILEGKHGDTMEITRRKD